jgi:hypothetical protein
MWRETDMATKVWGVDSAENVTEALFQCVKKNFGSPKFWGRYLSQVEGASEGLSQHEIKFIRDRGMKVMPIYYVFETAVGYEKGRVSARNAVYHARRLGIPKDIVIFANVERFFDVDEPFVRGWVESIYNTGYRPGFYHDSTERGFAESYCQAVQNNPEVAVQAILWSAEPETGISTEKNAPNYTPQAPSCKANVWAWQYGRDTEACLIDAVLADRKLLQFLY